MHRSAMSPTKRKIFASDTSDEDDSFKHRRSSLRVNLSYNDNLTDSGNGSLWRTEIENDERETNGVQSVRRFSRSKSTYEKSRRSDPDNKDMPAENHTKNAINNNEISVRVKKGVQIKRLTVNLEDISTKEHYLETSCKRLKDAILHKTKQIFDKENELTVKTSMVLGNRENSSASSTHPNIENKTVMLDITDHQEEKATGEHEQYTDTLSHRQREDQYSNIITTPMKNDGQRSFEKIMDKSRLTQRRLFVEKDKQMKGQTKCRIIENVILKKNLPLLSLRQVDESGSPILSGSNRRFSLSKSKLRSQNQFENLNNTYSTVHSIPNIDIEMPVGCSTFIENNAMVDKGTNNNTSCGTYTTNKVISMEMTKVHGGIHTSKGHLSLQNRSSDARNCTENNCNRKKKKKSKESSEETERNRNASNLEDIEHLINKITVQNNTAHFNLRCTDNVNDQDVASVHIDTVIPKQVSIEDAAAVTKTRKVLQAYKCDSKTKCQNERRCTISLSDSNDTIRSLNVNTSLDGVTETGKTRNIRKFNTRTNNANQETIINNKKSIVLNDQNESANTIRTSLQMNTSVDSVRKLCQRRGDKDKDRNHSNINIESSEYRYSSTETKETNNIDSLENISLIERLRNISMRNQVSRNDKSRISKMRHEDKRSSNSGDSYSYVEGTPYPISRSVLFKSQLKYKTQYLDNATCSNNLNSTDNENDKTKSIIL